MTNLTTVARPYARAAFEYGSENKMLDEWQSFLLALSEAIQHPEVQGFLKSSIFPNDQKVALCAQLLSKEIDTHQQNFLAILAKNNRLIAMPAIGKLFVSLRAEAEKILPAMVQSALPLDESDLVKIKGFLSEKFGRKVELDSEINEALIGGVLIRAGDCVIDHSVRGQLEKLKKVAVH